MLTQQMYLVTKKEYGIFKLSYKESMHDNIGQRDNIGHLI